jgi:hypothetical protein
MIINRYYGAAGPHITVGLINWDDEPATMRVARSELGLPAGMPVLVFDFWQQSLRLVQGDVFQPEKLAPHGCALLSLRPVVPGPQLAGTDFHISMGGEITGWNVDDNNIRLVITLHREAEGSIWLKLPAPPSAARCNGIACDIIVTDVPDLYRLQLRVHNEAVVEIQLQES